MSLFKKKADPLSERARVLNRQIAALEEQIRVLSAEPARPASVVPVQRHRIAPTPPTVASPPVKSRPRLRSTTRPRGQHETANPFISSQEPVIEEADQERLHLPAETHLPEPSADLGVRKYDLAALWQRIKNHFSGPSTSNPKLVNYLAAGSVQGLRPLRYEKRVARNRFLLFLGVLVAVLWGLAVIIFGRR